MLLPGCTVPQGCAAPGRPNEGARGTPDRVPSERRSLSGGWMVASIERSVEDMRSRRGTKWRKFPSDVLPAWVADMDFSVPAEVQEAVDRITTLGDYGYAAREGEESLAEAFQYYAKTSFGWDIDPAGVLPVGDLIQGMYSSVYAF